MLRNHVLRGLTLAAALGLVMGASDISARTSGGACDPGACPLCHPDACPIPCEELCSPAEAAACSPEDAAACPMAGAEATAVSVQ